MSSFRSRIRGRKPSSTAAVAAATTTNSSSSATTEAASPASAVRGGKINGKQALLKSNGSKKKHNDDETSAGTGTESSTNDSSLEIPQDVINQWCSSNSDNKTASAVPLVVNGVAVEDEVEEELLEEKEIKDQVILTDPKYKSNRIEKSSSRTRVIPLTSRKISAPPVMEHHHHQHKAAGGSTSASSTGSGMSSTVGGAVVNTVTPKKSTRSHSHLNLNSLYKSLLYAGGADKKLTSEDFDKMRKKSMSEVAKAAQPNSDAANSVKLIRHEFIDEVDDCSAEKRIVGPPGKMSLSDKVAAKLQESKKKRSKSKTRKRRGSRRSSCNNSAANIPVVLANKLREREEETEEDKEEDGDDDEGEMG